MKKFMLTGLVIVSVIAVFCCVFGCPLAAANPDY